MAGVLGRVAGVSGRGFQLDFPVYLPAVGDYPFFAAGFSADFLGFADFADWHNRVALLVIGAVIVLLGQVAFAPFTSLISISRVVPGLPGAGNYPRHPVRDGPWGDCHQFAPIYSGWITIICDKPGLLSRNGSDCNQVEGVEICRRSVVQNVVKIIQGFACGVPVAAKKFGLFY